MHIYRFMVLKWSLFPKALQDIQFIPVRVTHVNWLQYHLDMPKIRRLHLQKRADWLVTFPIFFGLNTMAKAFSF